MGSSDCGCAQERCPAGHGLRYGFLQGGHREFLVQRLVLDAASVLLGAYHRHWDREVVEREEEASVKTYLVHVEASFLGNLSLQQYIYF